MTNYPQRPNIEPARSATSSPLDDPGMRMILSMSPQDGSLRPLPSDLSVQESQGGILNVTYPDGSVRQLIPGAEGEGRMITTLVDGTRIQSDLTFGEGQVSVSSISSTGEKTLLSLNENGANMQRVTSDGQVFSFIPDSAPELIESFREAEAFAQAEDYREQEQFENIQPFGEWNNYGKPADWQPEQNWQPPATFMPPQNFDSGFQPGFQGGYPQPMPFMPPQPHNFGADNFGRPDYAGNNWVDNGNGSWIAPIQPDAFQQPQAWQPQATFMPPQPHNFGADNFGRPDYAGNNWVDNGNGSWIAPIQPDTFQQPQQFGEWNNYGKPVDWQPQPNWQPPATFMPPQPQNLGPQFGGAQGIIDTNGYPQPMPYMPPQNFGGDNFGRPDYAGNNWVDNGNGSWIAPVQPDTFQQPQAWQPPANFMPPQPQNFGPQFGGAQGIIDTNGYPQPMPFIPPHQGLTSSMGGFAPAQPTDAAGFPINSTFGAAQKMESFGNSSPEFAPPLSTGALAENVGFSAPNSEDDIDQSSQQY